MLSEESSQLSVFLFIFSLFFSRVVQVQSFLATKKEKKVPCNFARHCKERKEKGLQEVNQLKAVTLELDPFWKTIAAGRKTQLD